MWFLANTNKMMTNLGTIPEYHCILWTRTTVGNGVCNSQLS